MLKRYRVAQHAPHPIDVQALGRLVPPGGEFEAELAPHDKAALRRGDLVELGEPGDESRYERASMRDLGDEAERRGLEVRGTGEGGRLLKADLAAALQADDEKKG